MKLMGSVTEREKILKKYCRGKGLDIGASGNPIAAYIDHTCAKVDTQDIISPKDTKLTYLCPTDEIPTPPESYDFIYASHVLEHLNNPLKALIEWTRILRQNGYIIVCMPDCRLWVTDRKRFDIEELRGRSFARIEFLQEDFKNELKNQPQDWLSYKPYHSHYYYDHKYIWTSNYAVDMLKHAGLKILESIDSPAEFIKIFDSKLLPKYVGKIFTSENAGAFTEDILLLQEHSGYPLLDFSFIIVAQKPS